MKTLVSKKITSVKEAPPMILKRFFVMANSSGIWVWDRRTNGPAAELEGCSFKNFLKANRACRRLNSASLSGEVFVLSSSSSSS